jgi:hypothetical protein
MRATTLLAVILIAMGSLACRKQAPAEPAQPAAEPPAAQQPAAQQPAAPPADAPAAAPVETTVAELPDYPGATRVKLESGPKKGFARETEAKFTTVDPFEKVKAFYEEAIKSNGWQVVGTSQKANEIKWSLSKGTSLGEVSVEVEKTGGVSIKLERKDR